MQNPFRKPTPDEEAKIAQEKKEIEARVAKVAESARRLLYSQDAEKYRKDLEQSTKEMIKYMIANDSADPVKYAFFCRTCLTKLAAYYDILAMIEKDAEPTVMK